MTGARAVIAATVLILGVSACSSDDPEPIVAPTPSASEPSDPSTSPAAGAAAPAMPDAATEKTAAGAAAFAAYFVDVLNFAQRTGDTADLEQLGTEECAGCGGYVSAIRDTYDAGGRVVGGEISIGDFRELPKDYGADWGGYAKGSASAQVIVDEEGNRESYRGGRFPLYLYTKWSDGQWRVQWIRTPT